MVAVFRDRFCEGRAKSFHHGDILTSNVDAVVSPATSVGAMDGMIDLAYRSALGVQLEQRIRSDIADRFGGHLPVGCALLVPTGLHQPRWLGVAPTTELPADIRGTPNVELAASPAKKRRGFEATFGRWAR